MLIIVDVDANEALELMGSEKWKVSIEHGVNWFLRSFDARHNCVVYCLIMMSILFMGLLKLAECDLMCSSIYLRELFPCVCSFLLGSQVVRRLLFHLSIGNLAPVSRNQP